MEFTTKLIDKPTNLDHLKELSQNGYRHMIKAVVDLEKKVLAVGAEMHFDEEQFLLGLNSKQENLWGFNIRFDEEFPDSIEFDSMINIRPGQGNKSRSVEDEKIRQEILAIVKNLVYTQND